MERLETNLTSTQISVQPLEKKKDRKKMFLFMGGIIFVLLVVVVSVVVVVTASKTEEEIDVRIKAFDTSEQQLVFPTPQVESVTKPKTNPFKVNPKQAETIMVETNILKVDVLNNSGQILGSIVRNLNLNTVQYSVDVTLPIIKNGSYNLYLFSAKNDWKKLGVLNQLENKYILNMTLALSHNNTDDLGTDLATQYQLRLEPNDESPTTIIAGGYFNNQTQGQLEDSELGALFNDQNSSSSSESSL